MNATRGEEVPGVSGAGKVHDAVAGGEHLLDRMVSNISHGRFERSLSGLTALSALVTGAEVYLEHYKASFGNKWMWSPVVLTPPLVVAGIGGVFSKRWAKTMLPVTAAAYAANGLLGEYFHARGVARKPGGGGCIPTTCRWVRRSPHPD
jgi:hypothetical protein